MEEKNCLPASPSNTEQKRAINTEGVEHNVNNEERKPAEPQEQQDVDVFTEEEIDEIQKEHEQFLIFSDDGKLKRVSELFLAVLYQRHRRIVFCLEEDKFYQYCPQDGLWKPFMLSELEKLVTDFVNKFIRATKRQVASQKLGHSAIVTVLSVLKSRAGEKEFFKHREVSAQYWVHCRNGMLEFNPAKQAWDLMGFDPKYHSRSRLEIDYNPEATCPLFQNELIIPAIKDEADRRMLQFYAGQCMLGKNLSQKFLVITGGGGCRKSTVVNTIRKVIGQHNCTELRLEHANSRFEFSHYVGKSMLIGSDVGPNFLNNAGSRRLKSLTGKDPLIAEWKCSSNFCEIEGEFNVIVTSNHTLRVKLDSDQSAWLRRMLWIRFQNQPPENPIQDFEDEVIDKEGSGILNWFLAGARELLIKNGQIDLKPEQKERIERLLEETDPVKIFARDYIVRDENSDITNKELWADFNIIREQLDLPSVKRQEFNTLMRDAMDEYYNCAERHKIQRGAGQCRGYAHVRFAMPKFSES